MNDDVEKLLSKVTPRGAPPELRERVLDRVADALADEDRSETTASLPEAIREFASREKPSPDRKGVGPCDCEVPLPDGRGSEKAGTSLGTRLAWAVALMLLLGMGANFAAMRIGKVRMAAYEASPPEPVSNEQLMLALAQADGRNLDILDEHLRAVRWSRMSAFRKDSLRRYQTILRQTISLAKEPIHAVVQEDPQMDVHRRRRPGGDTTDCQRLFGLEHRRTA